MHPRQEINSICLDGDSKQEVKRECVSMQIMETASGHGAAPGQNDLGGHGSAKEKISPKSERRTGRGDCPALLVTRY